MKRRLKFHKTKFRETTEELCNPGRGWYRICPFCVEKEPDFAKALNELGENTTCTLVLLDILAYRDRALDEAALEHIDQIMSFFDTQKKDVILRVVYDREGKGMERDPALFAQVIEHIRQLKPMFQKYRNRIVLYQGMLVGSWGEMHTSRFLTKRHMQQLNDELKQSASGIMRAVRRPVQWRMLHSEMPNESTNVGLFDDAIFGSETDLGTFSADKNSKGGWEEAWPIGKELAFEEQLGAFVPQCGEAVYGENCLDYTLPYTIDRLKKMHLAYLNCHYDKKILSLWKEWNWKSKEVGWRRHDVWQDMNGYDYIGRHLGYRFCVREATGRVKDGTCRVNLKIENTGFAGFYQEGDVRLLLVGKNGENREYPMDWDIREWKRGQIKTLTGAIPAREGKIYLTVRRKWDGATVRFANLSTDEGWVFIGEM